ncbi:hypothetical protein GG496_000489 [Candidatus Fervidibacteria bacterium JGI MDM2 JNZ-1-D12]
MQRAKRKVDNETAKRAGQPRRVRLQPNRKNSARQRRALRKGKKLPSEGDAPAEPKMSEKCDVQSFPTTRLAGAKKDAQRSTCNFRRRLFG